MRCCVPGCKNDSRNISKSQGITFHVFPTEPTLRTAWLGVVRAENWRPKERSAVCSNHFHPSDLYHTKSGLRRVRTGAVPHLAQDTVMSKYGIEEETALNVCRICLGTQIKTYAMKKYNLAHTFVNITGLSLPEEDTFPQSLCAECVQNLKKCQKFKDKSLRSDSILTDLMNRHSNVTIQLIEAIDRNANHLTSNLQLKHFDPDYYDFHIEHTDSQMEEISDKLEIKNETSNEIFFNEDDDFNNEESLKSNSELIPDVATTINNVDLPNVQPSDIEDTDLPVSDKDFSSDDSIPLGKTKIRKKLKRKKPKSDPPKVRKHKVKTETLEPKIDRRRKPFLNDDLNETLFTITDLTFEEQIAEIVKRQESSNYKNAVYKCTECFKGFLDENAYNDHMSRHTKDCGEYQCEICKTHFKHSHALRKHITAHHTQRFSCNQCPYVTTHRQTARLHEKWHKGTKYQCPHCPEEFVKFTTYMGHIRIKHPSDFVCQLCGFSFISQKGIELHKKLKHRLEPPDIPVDGPLCELCNIRFRSADAHKQHLRVSARHNTSDNEKRESNKRKTGRKSRDPKEKEKKLCDETETEDMEEKNRMYPSQMRKAEGPIPCEQCGLQLEDSRAYHSHFRRTHPDKNRTNYPSMKSPCMCELCGRMFQSYALLKDHRWVHTGERPFRCDACGKTFRMKQRLVSHRKVHAQVKRSYVCNLCGKQFSTHSNRQRHMFIHTGLKPFKCEMCGKSFKHASEKRAHITYVHLKKPWPKRSRGKRRSDSRQGALPPQSAIPTGASEIDIVQPIWPACDPKLDHLNNIEMNRMDDKPMYYNLKI